jgi:hypothetical protein
LETDEAASDGELVRDEDDEDAGSSTSTGDKGESESTGTKPFVSSVEKSCEFESIKESSRPVNEAKLRLPRRVGMGSAIAISLSGGVGLLIEGVIDRVGGRLTERAGMGGLTTGLGGKEESKGAERRWEGRAAFDMRRERGPAGEELWSSRPMERTE